MPDDQQQQMTTPEPLATTPEPLNTSTISMQRQTPGADMKILAGVLGITLGAFGAHKFVLGYQQEGTILAAVGGVGLIGSFIPIIGCLTIFLLMASFAIGLIEGIIYLTKSDEEFENTYINNKKPWF